jgi:hypothetical protein
VKQALSLLVALGFGALVTYAIMSPRQQEEWGVVVTELNDGARLYGLFETKRECLNARTAFVEQYAAVVSRSTAGISRSASVEKTAREVIIKGFPEQLGGLATFSCLPLSDIRGLSLKTYRFHDDTKR